MVFWIIVISLIDKLSFIFDVSVFIQFPYQQLIFLSHHRLPQRLNQLGFILY